MGKSLVYLYSKMYFLLIQVSLKFLEEDISFLSSKKCMI